LFCREPAGRCRRGEDCHYAADGKPAFEANRYLIQNAVTDSYDLLVPGRGEQWPVSTGQFTRCSDSGAATPVRWIDGARHRAGQYVEAAAYGNSERLRRQHCDALPDTCRTKQNGSKYIPPATAGGSDKKRFRGS